jgi:hypothetical protein
MFNGDSSPFDPSPIASVSPRLYWQSRDPASPTRPNAENRNPMGDRDISPSPAKRSSIENLKRASRVKNSTMFAREHKGEYDPTSSPMIERPLASGRPLGATVQGNAYGGRGLEGFRKKNDSPIKNMDANALRSPTKMNEMSIAATKGQSSPTKSSLSSKSRYAKSHQAFDPDNSIWSDEEESFAERELPPGKSLHRHAKSVTFDAAPPQIQEYEMTTPDPSSVASESREGSYESVEDEEEESIDREHSIDQDDSFDASLEDTEKTPVVLPEDWRFMSPAIANEDLATRVEDPFDGEQRSSPAPTARPSSAIDARPSPTRTDSTNSNGERRPLPPLPALGIPSLPRARSDSNSSLNNTVERVSNAQRTAPSPPRPASISKAEIQGMGGCSMSIEERLRLMMLQDEDKPQTAAEEQQDQRERRLRRGSPVRSPELDENNEDVHAREEEVENDDVADLGDYKPPPRISRESILRKVKSRKFSEPEDDLYSSLALNPHAVIDHISALDPDVPIPSLESETIENAVTIKEEPMDDDGEIDVYSIPDLYNQQMEAESYMNAIEKLEAFQQSSANHRDDDDDRSHYSTDSKEDTRQGNHSNSATEDDGPPTPRALTSNELAQGSECENSHRMSLPQFAALLGESDYGFGMESFMTPSPESDHDPEKSMFASKPSWSPSSAIAQEPFKSAMSSRPSTAEQYLERPVTPEAQLTPPSFPGQRNDTDEEPRTPDSVIRHPFVDPPLPDSPGVPDPVATIKAPGGKLKTRPSITPTDIEAMAEVRRQVSSGGQVPIVPEIPGRHLMRPSVVGELDESEQDLANKTESLKSSEEREVSRKAQRKSSLLPLEVPVESGEGLGFGMESEFDRVIEAQKVAFNLSSPNVAAQPCSPGRAEYMPGQGFTPISGGYADRTFRTQKGYLMRQNTKVIIASSASHESAESTESATEAPEGQEPSARATRSAGNSPRKPSQPAWTAEPWNGKVRRKSIRKSGGVPSKTPSSGPVPPMPGQQSNVASALDSVTEDQAVEAMDEIGEDGERGRLFVKVLRVKDLDLPLPKGEDYL